MTRQDLLQLAISALLHHTQQTRPITATEIVLDKLRAELGKPEPEPFAYVTKTGLELTRQHEDDVPLYCKEDL